MKTTCIILLIAFPGIFSGVKAQTATYHSYPTTYATWMFEHVTYIDVPEYYYHRYIWAGDTTINAQTYQKVYAGPGYLWQNPSGTMEYMGAVRQDIANEQLFFLDLDNVEHDISIDQFLEVDDTIPNVPNLSFAFNMMPDYFGQPMISAFVVRAVETEPSGTGDRTVYELQPLNDIGEGVDVALIRYVSGVGATEIQQFEHYSWLRCHSIGDSLLVGNTDANPYHQNCTVGLEEETLQFSVSPNPATESVTIALQQNNGERADLDIFDLSGKQVLAVSGYVFGQALELKQLQPGSYIIGFQLNGRGYTYPLQLIR